MKPSADDDLIARHVEANPHRPGVDEARIVGRGVAVWALVAYVDGDKKRITAAAEDYDLPVEAVRAALAYYRRYKEAIDARIAANLV